MKTPDKKTIHAISRKTAGLYPFLLVMIPIANIYNAIALAVISIRFSPALYIPENPNIPPKRYSHMNAPNILSAFGKNVLVFKKCLINPIAVKPASTVLKTLLYFATST